MLHKCANPSCSTQFRRLREGKLFQLETEYFPQELAAGSSSRKMRPTRHVEHYWLCDECCRYLTLAFDGERGMTTVPFSDPQVKKASGSQAQSHEHMRQAALVSA
jgi:hypothetical protein